MFERNPKPFGSPTMPFGPLDPPAGIRLHRIQQKPKGRGVFRSMIHGVYDTACVCIDAIMGRYDP